MNIYRILRNLSAHGYGQLITVISTLFIPTLAVAKWGTEGFGYWISLTALAQFFLMSDLGASIALTNQLCLKSNRTANDAWLLVRAVVIDFIKNSFIIIIIIIILTLVIGIYYRHQKLEEQAVSLAVTFLVLALSAALQPVLGIYSSIWRFKGNNEIGIFVEHTVGFVYILVIVASVLFSKGICVTAITVLVIRVISTLLILLNISKLILKKNNIIYSSNTKMQIVTELKLVKRAGYGFMIISLSQQLALQGPVLLIATILGPVQAAAFAASRTLSRLPVQPLTAFLASINPELTELVANKEYEKMKLIVKKIALPVMIFSILIGSCEIFYIDAVEKFWLAGKLILNLKVLIPLYLSGTIFLGGQIINQTLTSANQTYNQSRHLLVVSAIMIVIMCILLLFTNQPMWCAITILASECLMTILLLRRFMLF